MKTLLDHLGFFAKPFKKSPWNIWQIVFCLVFHPPSFPLIQHSLLFLLFFPFFFHLLLESLFPLLLMEHLLS